MRVSSRPRARWWQWIYSSSFLRICVFIPLESPKVFTTRVMDWRHKGHRPPMFPLHVSQTIWWPHSSRTVSMGFSQQTLHTLKSSSCSSGFGDLGISLPGFCLSFSFSFRLACRFFPASPSMVLALAAERLPSGPAATCPGRPGMSGSSQFSVAIARKLPRCGPVPCRGWPPDRACCDSGAKHPPLPLGQCSTMSRRCSGDFVGIPSSNAASTSSRLTLPTTAEAINFLRSTSIKCGISNPPSSSLASCSSFLFAISCCMSLEQSSTRILGAIPCLVK
mmetsp:Transcript_4743/g.10099  ORF Transcript_4743/g.10099 Transcript_4743/m.10099 type:complete len:278 (-) Transcript_4743:1825-2658(-)